jgi:pimeloyl-ACP methyl ester carboxylesterase
MRSELMEAAMPVFFVAHSMGGIYALHLANLEPKFCLGAVTLSTPYGGSKIANFAKYIMPSMRMIGDVASAGGPIKEAKSFSIIHPWTNIVTTRSARWWYGGDNDGVVSVSSMTSREDMELVFLNVNHFEVVVSNQALSIVNQNIKKAIS